MALEVVRISHLTGKITLRSPSGKTKYVLDKDFGHIAHDYCATSHASQGRTVDEVFISQPAATFGATDAKQFYVSVSRGRDAVHVFTDDKAALLENAQGLGERQSALELVNNKDQTTQILQKHRQKNALAPDKKPDKAFTHSRTEIDIDYEPL